MKKYLFLAVALIATLSSCSEVTINDICGEPMKFTATIDEGEGTKTVMFANSVKWRDNDQISINGSIFETDSWDTTGDFTKVSGDDPTAPYEAYYPASYVVDGTATLPSTQRYYEQRNGNIDVRNAPMFARSENNSLKFKNICALLKIEIDQNDIDCVNKIRVSSSNHAMCGAYTVDEYYNAALINPDDYDKYVEYEISPSQNLASGLTYYVAIPPQTYQNLKVELFGDVISVSMSTKLNTNITVERNKIYTISFKADKTPKPTLIPGEFSIGETKKVQFARGNLYYDGSEWKMEEEQFLYRGRPGGPSCLWGTELDYGTPSGHYGAFLWRTSASEAMTPDKPERKSYQSPTHLFTNNGSVEILGGGWRVLTKTEWEYMTVHRYPAGTFPQLAGPAMVAGVKGTIVRPDVFVDPLTNTGTKGPGFYENGMDFGIDDCTVNIYSLEGWDAMETAGAVFFPYGSYLTDTNDPDGLGTNIFRIEFISDYSQVYQLENDNPAYIRLVKDVKK